jgi:TolA-binding protein
MAKRKPAPPLTGQPELVKPAAPEILDAAVIAYLQKQADTLAQQIAALSEEIKRNEIQYISQLNRVMGQQEGKKEQLEAQLADIQAKIAAASPPPAPPVAPPGSEPAPLTPDPELPIM